MAESNSTLTKEWHDYGFIEVMLMWYFAIDKGEGSGSGILWSHVEVLFPTKD